MIMAWLINLMEPDIGQVYLFLTTTQTIWEAMANTYSNRGNSAQAFALKIQLKAIRPEDHNVTHYFDLLMTLLQELDHLLVPNWMNPNDSLIYQKLLKNYHIYKFLGGLNPEYDAAQ